MRRADWTNYRGFIKHAYQVRTKENKFHFDDLHKEFVKCVPRCLWHHWCKTAESYLPLQEMLTAPDTQQHMGPARRAFVAHNLKVSVGCQHSLHTDAVGSVGADASSDAGDVVWGSACEVLHRRCSQFFFGGRGRSSCDGTRLPSSLRRNPRCGALQDGTKSGARSGEVRAPPQQLLGPSHRRWCASKATAEVNCHFCHVVWT
jgi:hypothetical protein